MLSAAALTMDDRWMPLPRYWEARSSSRIMAPPSAVIPCSVIRREPRPKIPRVNCPLPPTEPWRSTHTTFAPSSAACTQAARPELPAPTMTMSQETLSDAAVSFAKASSPCKLAAVPAAMPAMAEPAMNVLREIPFSIGDPPLSPAARVPGRA